MFGPYNFRLFESSQSSGQKKMRITITHRSDAGAGRSWTFDGSRPIKIGRHAQNDVVFDGSDDRAVSGHHAELRMESGHLIIEDKASMNGVWIEGTQVKKAKIFSGVEVRLGVKGTCFAVTIEGADAPQPPQLKPTPTKKYGERTVGMMIQKALAQAGLVRESGTSKSTQYFEALVESRVRQTGAKLRWAAAIALLLVAAGVGFGIYFYSNRQVQYIQTTQVNYGDAVGRSVAASNRYAIFLLAGEARETELFQGFCTAFAVSTNVLATNAHCVISGLEKFKNPVALLNGVPQRPYTIVKMLAHPSYRDGGISPDVGLVQLRESLSQTVQIATNQELGQVVPGAPVFLYGFPGRLNKVEAPEATFVKGEIGRITSMDQKPADFTRNTLLQHSAFSSAGTSGSPIFDANGKVIGINAGGYTEDGQILTGYNFGMRIDLIYPLFNMFK